MLDIFPAMNNTTGTVLRTARKQRGFVLRQVASVAGVTAQAVGNWETDANDITMDNLRKVAGFLGIDAEAASRGVLVYTDGEADLSEAQRISSVELPELGPRDVALLGVSVGGDDADFTFNGQVIDHLRRPPGIATLKGVFATQIIGTSMIPRFEPGEVIYCGGKQPIGGDYVVIEMFPEDGAATGKCYIKRMLRRTPAQIFCDQFNPPMELPPFDAYGIKQLSRVIPWSELLGY